MAHETFWLAVHDALDARQAPLDHPWICAHLEAHPELLEEFASLTAGAAAIDPIPTDLGEAKRPASTIRGVRAGRPAADRSPWQRAAALAGLALAVPTLTIAAWWWTGNDSDAPPPTPNDLEILGAELPDLALDGRVEDYSCRTTVRSRDGTFVRTVEAGNFSLVESEIQTTVRPRVETRHGHSIHTRRAHLRSHVRTDRITQNP